MFNGVLLFYEWLKIWLKSKNSSWPWGQVDCYEIWVLRILKIWDKSVNDSNFIMIFHFDFFFQIRLIVQVCFNKYILLFYSLLDPQCRYNFQDTKRDNVVHWHRRLRGYDWRICCNYCQGVCSVRIDTYSSWHIPWCSRDSVHCIQPPSFPDPRDIYHEQTYFFRCRPLSYLQKILAIS